MSDKLLKDICLNDVISLNEIVIRCNKFGKFFQAMKVMVEAI